MELPFRTIVILGVTILVLSAVVAFFLLGLQLSPLDASRTFSQGCVTFCAEIQAEAASTGRPIDVIAQEKAEQLEGSDFARACSQLHPDAANYVYLCWTKSCCSFQLRPP